MSNAALSCTFCSHSARVCGRRHIDASWFERPGPKQMDSSWPTEHAHEALHWMHGTLLVSCALRQVLRKLTPLRRGGFSLPLPLHFNA